MEEIRINEYIRTKKGKIAKVKTIYSEEDRIKMKNFSVKKETLINGTIKIPDIVNHSFNIIDLIEVGDYVNGKLIHHTDIRKNSAYIYYGNGKTFVDYQIENVVTKEQFESIKYEVIK